MSSSSKSGRKLKLKHFLFLVLLVSGIVPLVTSSVLLVRQNTEILETQEKGFLTRSSQALSDQLNTFLVNIGSQVRQVGEGLLVVPQPAALQDKLRAPWVGDYLIQFLTTNPNLLGITVVDREGQGPRLLPGNLADSARTALATAYEQARSHAQPVYRFVVLPSTNEPVVVFAVPVGEGVQQVFVQALARLDVMQSIFAREARGDVAAFLVDREGKLLWSEGADPTVGQAVRDSPLVQDFMRRPMNLTGEYTVRTPSGVQTMLGQVSPVEATGWGVVVHKPRSTALAVVQQMVLKAALLTALLIPLAFFIAIFAARAVSQPMQRLAESTHRIAKGNFGERVEAATKLQEIGDLGDDFNRMSGYVEDHVEKLRRAAVANRELFIGSIRSFAAAIDAKDPYTRGHSERVASYSRTIANALGMSPVQQDRIWMGGILHDVGKIGVEDKVLKKAGVLTDEEYEQIKLHTVIGAEIMSQIAQLKDVIPIIRSHHEAWNGSGYPDGLKGEQIPLIARIVGVADTFDAITTNRPYHDAHPPEFAVKTIKKLTGARFEEQVVAAFLKAYEAGEIQSTWKPETEAAAVPELRAAVSSS